MVSDNAYCLGLDVGSVALKLVLTDRAGRLVQSVYRRTHSRPGDAALEALGELLAAHPAANIDLAAVTGSGAILIGELLKLPCVNEVISQAVAIRALRPEVRTLIEMGGQDSKIVFLPEPGDPRPMLDFSMNTNCAAGTGSFLDQQASRLGIKIEDEFSQLALKSVTPPRVAGRCSVFAKSDMIHLQQKATPLHDIVAGLCLGLARNLKSNLAAGRALPHPIAFCGGVAANGGVVRALEQVFGLEPGGLIVPREHAFTGALGAVLVSLQERARLGSDHARPAGGRLDLKALRDYLASVKASGTSLAPLLRPSNGHANGSGQKNGNGHPGGNGHASGSEPKGQPTVDVKRHGSSSTPVDAWLGLDVGSISTKIAVIDAGNQVLAKIYLMTAGQPIEAVRKVLREIGGQIAALPFPVVIRGAATTGSGRYLTGDIIGADLVINEITAQATAAAAIDPEVESIFEIGGQDSKYIALDHGVVVDFEMNHACAAGTGSFLEEQAERLGVSIKRQFADLAFSSQNPTRLGERCTVFMESDLLSHQQKGAPTPDLAAGLCYSIVTNYLNRVVGQRKIGRRIFFQGGTAFNEGVVAAFRQVTGRPVVVPAHHEITGAIGAAMLARQHMQTQKGETRFAGFGAADIKYELRTFECEHCSNTCEINEVTVAGRDPLFYGSRCDRFNTKKESRDTNTIPNLFNERHVLLLKHAAVPPAPKKGETSAKRTVGLPLALLNYQLLPFWSALLKELGLQPVLSPPSSATMIREGIEATLSTPCFPIKVAHGHVFDLAKRGVDFIFLPAIVTLKKEFLENRFHEACPYVTFFPYTISAALEAQELAPKLLMPSIRFDMGPRGVVQGLKTLRQELNVTTRQLRTAVDKAWAAQNGFEEALKARGREILASLPEDGSGVRPVVVISRPYNGCDKHVSLDLAAKLRRLNVLAIPMDFLDLPGDQPTGDQVFTHMYWKYGQRILHAAKMIRNHPRLHALYLSNFSCGPDSFLLSFFKRLMAPKPSLVLEIDEHSADAGVVTRLEAFLESLHHAAPARELPQALPLYPTKTDHPEQQRKVLLPWMSDHSYVLAASFRAHGVNAQVLPLANDHTLAIGRKHCTGKECLPCLITAGDMLHATQEPGFDADQTAFLMPRSCGPCRFGQYASYHKVLLQEAGLPQIPIIDPGDDSTFYDAWTRSLGNSSRLAWNAMCAASALYKCLLALRPYEINPGRANPLYQSLLDQLVALIEKKPTEVEIADFAAQAARAFERLPVDRTTRKPVIGVTGEIYVRSHDVANNFLVAQLEKLGAEASVTSMLEWVYYCNWTRKNLARRERTPRLWLTNFIQDEVQRRIAKRINRPFERLLGNIEESRTGPFLEKARFCVDPEFEGGEAVLSVAKAVELQHEGAHGVICVMPFGCMPTTVFAGLRGKIAQHTGDMPILTVAYDGQQDPTLHTRLEAFVHQARVYQETREAAVAR
jgi:predicted CoA-substrate-specific enzyme activase